MNTQNFIICLDNNVTIGAGTLITSVVVNNPNTNCHFHLYGLKSEIIKIKSLLDHRFAKLNFQNLQISYYNIDEIPYMQKIDSELKRIIKKANRNLTIAAFYRLVAFNNISFDAKQAIYLDTDVLCTGPLDEMFNLDLGDKVLGAVEDVDAHIEYARKELDFKSDKYFNSGVLVLNVKKWHELNLTEKAIEILIEKEPKQIDQDALNMVSENMVHWLDIKFNSITNETLIHVEDALLVHCSGSEKPWKPWIKTQKEDYESIRDTFEKYNRETQKYELYPEGDISEIVREYRKYLAIFEPDESKWFSLEEENDILWLPSSIHDFKKMRIIYMKHKMYLKALKTIFAHYKQKIKRMGLLSVLLGK